MATGVPDGWIRYTQPSEARFMVGCGVTECGDNARWKRGNEFRCHVHVSDAEPEQRPGEEALRAQLREAAAHIGDLLAIPPSSCRTLEQHKQRDAARAWLKAYLSKGGA